ncbi:uncharacterized protein LOC133782913 isoform X1 [Humulus lupulus]|uniref:uncharacterized protein LOC133782913 isoform X1 n=1 Tax=Humulus lupulus TaxID=3486 RepID=UPI002B4098B5|nr:uncharacterized protein LOC133782913 isoform X1 [Humulus lupulus]XP_062078347.1 uncharacterized protein LOC133782913 isoform X1 [Humulus lupulus]
MDDDIGKLIEYIFDDSLNSDETLVDTGFNHLTRGLVRTLCPGVFINGEVLNVVCEMNTRREQQVSTESRSSWYLNTRMTCIGISIQNLFPQSGRSDSARKLFIGDLNLCGKIKIPVHNEEMQHWVLFIVHVGNGVVEICDSFLLGRKESLSQSLVPVVLQQLDLVLRDELSRWKGPVKSFTCFKAFTNNEVVQQSNGYDCGIHVINWMAQRNPSNFKPKGYNSDDERAHVAVGLVTSLHNKVRDQVRASTRTKTNSARCVGK